MASKEIKVGDKVKIIGVCEGRKDLDTTKTYTITKIEERNAHLIRVCEFCRVNNPVASDKLYFLKEYPKPLVSFCGTQLALINRKHKPYINKLGNRAWRTIISK